MSTWTLRVCSDQVHILTAAEGGGSEEPYNSHPFHFSLSTVGSSKHFAWSQTLKPETVNPKALAIENQ